MASAYPGALDSFATNKADGSVTSGDHAAHHNDLADAINKIEAELGTDPSGALATVKARLDALPRILAQSAVAVSHTGNTNEVALVTLTIPGGTLGPNGRLRVTAMWSFTNSAGAKTCRVRWGGLSGTIIYTLAPTTTNVHRAQAEIANRGATNSQIGGHPGGTGGWGTNAVVAATAARDTTVDQTVVISGQLATAGDTVTLESYVVELLP